MELKKFFSDINAEDSLTQSQNDTDDPIALRFKATSNQRPPTKSATIEAFITGIKSELLKFEH